MFTKRVKLPDNLKVAMVATRRVHAVLGAFWNAYCAGRLAEWANHSFLITFLICQGLSRGVVGPGR